MYFDPMYFVVILPAFLLAMWAQFKVEGAYSKYTKVPNQRGLTGLDAARIILPSEGLGHVSIEGIPGELTDHYDPRKKVLRLSAAVHDGNERAPERIHVAPNIAHVTDVDGIPLPAFNRCGDVLSAGSEPLWALLRLSRPRVRSKSSMTRSGALTAIRGR